MNPLHIPGTPDWLAWRYPWAFALLAILPLLWWLWLRPAGRAVIRFPNVAGLKAAGGTISRRMIVISPILRTIALIALILAVARPQKADESSRTFAEGIAIQMVVDVSSSMRDTDLSPPGERLTRLDVVKDVFRRFVLGEKDNEKLPGRKNDIIGMVRFAGYADAICPLTLDHENLVRLLNATRTISEMYVDGSIPGLQRANDEDGTAIGDGLALAVERLRDLKRTAGSGEQIVVKSKIAILLTDGQQNAGTITPRDAGDLAALNKIKVYTILSGTGERTVTGRRLRVPDDDLRYIADISGGKFFVAGDAKSLENIYAEIDKLERTKTEERHFVRWGELAFPLLVVAASALGLQSLLDSTRLRRIP